MLITVEVTKTELEEMGMTRDELKQSVIADLNNSDVDGDYVGFNVIVIIGQQVKR